MFGMLFVRDKENETFEVTLESGYDTYKNKYNDEPLFIECSFQDIKEEFIYKTAKVIPCKYFNKGIIWITGKHFEGYKR